MMRRGRASDLKAAGEIYDQARKRLKIMGVDQWQGPYPGGGDFLEDVKKGRSFVWEDGEGIFALAALILGKEPSYEKIQGAWKGADAYETIHRIALHDRVLGRGEAKKLFQDLEEEAGKRVDFIRIDTHEDNKIMQGLLRKLDYEYAGIIELPDGSPRLAFEKRLGGEK